MIPAVAQTLAEILAGGTSPIRMEQIDFNHPSAEQGIGPRVNLYCYDLRENHQMQKSGQHTDGCTIWFDLSFVVTAWDRTALGEQYLLSEALMLLVPHRFLPEEQLAPVLRGKGTLPMRIFADRLSDTAALWRALGVPLRPGLYLTVTVPFTVETQPIISQKISLTSTT